MRITEHVGQQVGALLLAVLFVCAPPSGLAMSTQQDQDAQTGTPPADQVPPAENGQAEATQPQSSSTQPLPDSPGTTRAAQPPAGTQTPAGTAAAEVSNASGVAASKPAGVAIAPAKQRRVRSFLIKMGAIVGAGVAVGTVFALSQGSPSRPPGAR